MSGTECYDDFVQLRLPVRDICVRNLEVCSRVPDVCMAFLDPCFTFLNLSMSHTCPRRGSVGDVVTAHSTSSVDTRQKLRGGVSVTSVTVSVPCILVPVPKVVVCVASIHMRVSTVNMGVALVGMGVWDRLVIVALVGVCVARIRVCVWYT